MPFSSLLIHEARIYRRSGRTDRFGQPTDVNPRQATDDDLVHTYPCRITRGTGGLVMRERAIDTFEVMWTMYTDAGVDIREDDAVTVVDPRTGEVLVPTAKVKVKSGASGMDAMHHLEFQLWAQKGPS